MNIRYPYFALLLVASGFAPAAVTYHDPVRSQVLNWAVMLDGHQRNVTPLYLETPGTYVAEIYLEPVSANSVSLNAPATLAFSLQISRRGKAIVTRNVQQVVKPDTSGLTLFTLESPYDLPEDTDLEVALQFREIDPRLEQAFGSMRLQLTRKPRFAPIPQWQ